MVYFSDVELSKALLWLTTSRLDEGPFELLAVVLDDSSEATFLETVNRAQPQVDPISDHVLVMSLSRGSAASMMRRGGVDPGLQGGSVVYQQSGYPNPPWMPDVAKRSREASDWLKELFTVITQKVAEKPGVDHLDAVLELLGLDRRVLPAIYLRARRALPIIATPNGPAQAIQLLKVLSGAFQGPGTHTAPVQAYLQTLGVAGFSVEQETQDALDHALEKKVPDDPASKASVEWTRIGPMVEHMWRPHSGPSRFRRTELVATVQNVLEREYRSAIDTAVWAHDHGDWGTVARNIGAVIEGSLATSFAQLARSRVGDPEVRLPRFFNLWDPLARDVLIGRHDLNLRRAGVVAEGPGARIPWQPPTLKPGVDVFIHIARQPEAPVAATNTQLGDLHAIVEELALLRNPAAHGTKVTIKDAEKAWGLLDRWVELGFAHWALRIRDRLLSGRWPPDSTADRPRLLELAPFRRARHVVEGWEEENRKSQPLGHPASLIEKERRSLHRESELQSEMVHLVAFLDGPRDVGAHRRLSRALRPKWSVKKGKKLVRAELVFGRPTSPRRRGCAPRAGRADTYCHGPLWRNTNAQPRRFC